MRLTVLPQHQRVQNRQTVKQTGGIAISRIALMIKCGRAIKTDVVRTTVEVNGKWQNLTLSRR